MIFHQIISGPCIEPVQRLAQSSRRREVVANAISRPGLIAARVFGGKVIQSRMEAWIGAMPSLEGHCASTPKGANADSNSSRLAIALMALR